LFNREVSFKADVLIIGCTLEDFDSELFSDGIISSRTPDEIGASTESNVLESLRSEDRIFIIRGNHECMTIWCMFNSLERELFG